MVDNQVSAVDGQTVVAGGILGSTGDKLSVDAAARTVVNNYAANSQTVNNKY